MSSEIIYAKSFSDTYADIYDYQLVSMRLQTNLDGNKSVKVYYKILINSQNILHLQFFSKRH